jgi:hypothetical protein
VVGWCESGNERRLDRWVGHSKREREGQAAPQRQAQASGHVDDLTVA